MAKKPAKEAVELAAPVVEKTPARKKKTKQPAARAPDKKEPEKKARRKPLTTAEWRKIRMEYVKGKTTFAKLAEKYQLTAGHIRKRASLEGWSKKKRDLDTKTEQKTIERVSDARARELERLVMISERVDDFLDETVKAFGQIKPRKYDELRGVESLTKAIQIAVQTKRDLYNLPNEADRAKIESLREKAKLDREKYEEEKAEKARMAAEAGNTMIRVVIEGESEGGALDE